MRILKTLRARLALLAMAGFLTCFAAAKNSAAWPLCTPGCWSDDWGWRVCCTTEDCFDYCI